MKIALSNPDGDIGRTVWAWLRESAQPEARVADTLFVCQLNGQTVPAQ